MNRALIIVITIAALVGLTVGLVAPVVASKLWPPLTTLATRSSDGMTPEEMEAMDDGMGKKDKVPVVTVSSEASAIIEQFDCACGSCQIPLKDCTCDMPRGSVEMKRFIEDKVKEGKGKQQIVQLVKKKYGI